MHGFLNNSVSIKINQSVPLGVLFIQNKFGNVPKLKMGLDWIFSDYAKYEPTNSNIPNVTLN